LSLSRWRTSARWRQACSTASRSALAPANSRSKSEHVFQAMDVVLDPGEAHHAAVALERVQRAQDPRDDLGIETVALEGEERVVEGLEVRAGVLEVDVEQLRGDLEVGHRLDPNPRR
jgi:hypothetical protein